MRALFCISIILLLTTWHHNQCMNTPSPRTSQEDLSALDELGEIEDLLDRATCAAIGQIQKALQFAYKEIAEKFNPDQHMTSKNLMVNDQQTIKLPKEKIQKTQTQDPCLLQNSSLSPKTLKRDSLEDFDFCDVSLPK